MQVKKAYVADLKALHAECGSNYLRLTRILGKAEAGDSFAFPLAGNQGHFGTLLLEVVECAPYTTMVTVAQTGVLDHIIDSPSMSVHLYHDVRMAEVTDFQRQRHFSGRNRYPNPRMHQPDEKLQLNRFLGEWLTHARAFGQADVPQLP